MTVSKTHAKAVENGYEAWKKEQREKAKYIVYFMRPSGNDKTVHCVTETQAIAIARYLDSQSFHWEKVLIDFEGKEIPYKIYVANRETGTVIDEIKGCGLIEGIEKALGMISDYEADDRVAGTYEKDFYDVIDEHGCSYIY